VIPRLTDLDVRLAAMDKAGVDMQAVAPVPQSHAWAGRALAERIVAVTNEAVAGFCARQPARLLPVGTVALQHPDLAAEQLRHAVTELGLRGVQISTAAAPGVELDDPRLAEFWAAAEETGAAVLIHPWGCTLGSRLNAYYCSTPSATRWRPRSPCPGSSFPACSNGIPAEDLVGARRRLPAQLHRAGGPRVVRT
jgi:predicted TIM-barrel fold metal-dependent hydrolase